MKFKKDAATFFEKISNPNTPSKFHCKQVFLNLFILLARIGSAVHYANLLGEPAVNCRFTRRIGRQKQLYKIPQGSLYSQPKQCTITCGGGRERKLELMWVVLGRPVFDFFAGGETLWHKALCTGPPGDPEGEKFPVIALDYQHRRSASALFVWLVASAKSWAKRCQKTHVCGMDQLYSKVRSIHKHCVSPSVRGSPKE